MHFKPLTYQFIQKYSKHTSTMEKNITWCILV